LKLLNLIGRIQEDIKKVSKKFCKLAAAVVCCMIRLELNIMRFPCKRLFCYVKNVKSFPSLKARWAARIFVSLALSQTPVFTLRDHGYGASELPGVPVLLWCCT